MMSKSLSAWLVGSALLPVLAFAGPTPADNVQAAIDWARQQPSAQQTHTHSASAPLIIAHRGASGYAPEHTLAAYALAILQGADYIEPDLVMTRDGQLVARHDNELGLTTDVAQRPEFAERKRTQTVDGVSLEGWFSEDFTLAELKTLRAIERIPQQRPGNTRFDGQFEIPTLQEIIDLAKSLEASQQRVIGLYPETKHPTHFQRLNLAMEEPLLATLKRNGYDSAEAPVYIQSFEVDNLQKLSKLTAIRLVQLLWVEGQPYDQQVLGSGLGYQQMITPEGLKNIARYASGIGPEKGMIIPRDAAGNLTKPTSLVRDAHAAKLKVHPYTFRAENAFLPTSLRNGSEPAERGDIEAELRAFLATGIDGLFIDQPDIAVRLRQQS
ncbi:glycerophosphodiester phosphodiesterase [Pseudomonas sp. GD03721]|nr:MULTISPECIES: glycerophosphodiester phosphodiesterase [unclassified Pseudomonas]MDH1441953.1 glycerophosphodiester phosphodiesterase [Pseudomonas sp. GD03722]WGG03884.1 glycerophosphodiester phosphodiesterase [Pseudomonas sp. GD03721]WGG08050.1 glycerophosphodiester phosphodiesterase [Pseudomonas sp. GD03919]